MEPIECPRVDWTPTKIVVRLRTTVIACLLGNERAWKTYYLPSMRVTRAARNPASKLLADHQSSISSSGVTLSFGASPLQLSGWRRGTVNKVVLSQTPDHRLSSNAQDLTHHGNGIITSGPASGPTKVCTGRYRYVVVHSDGTLSRYQTSAARITLCLHRLEHSFFRPAWDLVPSLVQTPTIWPAAYDFPLAA